MCECVLSLETAGTPGGTNSSVGGNNSVTNGIKRKYFPK